MERSFTWEIVFKKYLACELYQHTTYNEIRRMFQPLFEEPVKILFREEEEDAEVYLPFHKPPRRADETRTFTLDEILEYAEGNLSLDAAMSLQIVLHGLLVEDGTPAEHQKVASISKRIIERGKGTINYFLGDIDTLNLKQ